MTGNDEQLSMSAINICRDINRKAANQYAAKAISPEDIAIAAVYSAFDVAEAVKGPGVTAIEWMRTALDEMERLLIHGEAVQ